MDCSEQSRGERSFVDMSRRIANASWPVRMRVRVVWGEKIGSCAKTMGIFRSVSSLAIIIAL